MIQLQWVKKWLLRCKMAYDPFHMPDIVCHNLELQTLEHQTYKSYKSVITSQIQVEFELKISRTCPFQVEFELDCYLIC